MRSSNLTDIQVTWFPKPLFALKKKGFKVFKRELFRFAVMETALEVSLVFVQLDSYGRSLCMHPVLGPKSWLKAIVIETRLSRTKTEIFCFDESLPHNRIRREHQFYGPACLSLEPQLVFETPLK